MRLTSLLIFITFLFENSFQAISNEFTSTKKLRKEVERLVNQWAPLIFLAPNEKFKPSSIEDFIKHVYPANSEGNSIRSRKESNQNLFLNTVEDVDALLIDEQKSFLHGRDNLENVPVYALISYCGDQKYNSSLRFFVSYWVFSPYNLGKEICFIGKVPMPSVFSTCFGKKIFMGSHVGDWEHTTLLFENLNHPSTIYVSSHEFGAFYQYNPYLKTFIYKSQKETSRKKMLQNVRFPKFLLVKNDHPVLFSAYGSHGFWSEPGSHTYFMVPKLQDITGFGDKWETWRNLKMYHLRYDNVPKWFSYKGRWGNPRSNCILFKNLGLCKQADGPQGPKNTDFDCNEL